MKILCTALLLLAFTPLYSIASGEELNYNLINLMATAQKNIDNNVLIVTMRSSADADSAQKAAKIVNQEMLWAQTLLKETPEIKKQTINYQTHPKYQNKVIVGWSVSQQLQLESEEIDTLSNIVGNLQEKLQVSSMNFGINSEQKEANTETLITEALALFQAKSKVITERLGAKDFRIVTLTISENAPAIPRQRSYQMEAMAMSAADTPQIEAGESELMVRVNGTIQLVF